MFVIRLLSRLPLSVLYGLSDFLFFCSYYVVRYRRKKVWQNLRNSFPEKTTEELREIEKDFFRNLCHYAVEMLKLATISQEELSRRMIFRNIGILEAYKNKNQSVLVLASHHFNWEWLLAAGNFSLPLPLDFVYQPLSNSFFDRFSLTCRTRFGAFPIKRDEVARATIRRKNILRCIAIVADQYPGLKNDKRYYTPFLNQRTAFFLGANQLALVTQFPVMYMEMRKVKRGYYEATFREIAIPPFAKEEFTVIDNYVHAVEKVIRENPSTWLWSHNRWKKKRDKRSMDQDSTSTMADTGMV